MAATPPALGQNQLWSRREVQLGRREVQLGSPPQPSRPWRADSILSQLLCLKAWLMEPWFGMPFSSPTTRQDYSSKVKVHQSLGMWLSDKSACLACLRPWIQPPALQERKKVIRNPGVQCWRTHRSEKEPAGRVLKTRRGGEAKAFLSGAHLTLTKGEHNRPDFEKGTCFDDKQCGGVEQTQAFPAID